MDQSRPANAPHLEKDDGLAQEIAPGAGTPASASPTVSQPNGVTNHGPNAALANGHSDGTGDPSPAALHVSSQLDQSWRESGAFPSLGMIMERQAQHCYQNLNRCLTSMSELAPEPQHQQSNGVAPGSHVDPSKASQQKKRLLMDFAKEQREFFVKSLVLLDWCRNAEDIYKIKDVCEWQRRQSGAQTAAADAFLRIKNNMIPAKMPNPNIRGAMEVMSTSKAEWIPDLGYLPAKRLSARQLLDTLQNMNVILATRLALHEDLPTHMQDYSIANGRASFTVQDEFEVDLSVANEDPTTPFYFIDIRLLYQPSSTLLSERFRAQAEWRVNHALASKGLQGAYDFLHNFILTHKLNVLRSQAFDLMRGKWFDCIRVEQLRRSLVIQYWTTRPGKSSWLEFGVSSGKDDSVPAGSRIGVRWFRDGSQVTEQSFEFDWKTLDLEQCLSTVIAKHTSWLLQNIQLGLTNLAPPGSGFTCSLSTTDDSCSQSVLALTLPSARAPLSVHVELVTGQVSISPPSRSSREIEQRLNKDNSADSAKWLASLVCGAVQEQMHKEAQLIGWSSVSDLARQDNQQALFGEKGRYSVFLPNKAWGTGWALAVTFGLGGEKWWVVQLTDQRDDPSRAAGKIISGARRVSERGGEYTARISKSALLRIEKIAASDVAFAVLSKELKELRVPHRLQEFESLGPAASRSSRCVSTGMLIDFSCLMGHRDAGAWKPWAEGQARLTHHGTAVVFEETAQGSMSVRHDLRLALRPGKLKNLRKLISAAGEDGIAINSAGTALGLKVLSGFGQPYALQLRTLLQGVERLDRQTTILERRQFECEHASLSRLAFLYNTDPRLTARLTSSDDQSTPLRLRLEPADSNPHLRIRAMLEQAFGNSDEGTFGSFTYILTMTLPLLQAFDRLECVDPGKRAAAVHPRTPTWFRLRYTAPLPDLTFQIRLRTLRRSGRVFATWHILQMRPPHSSTAPAAPLPDELAKALKELWRFRDDHCLGLGNGVAADAAGIGSAVDRLDETVRSFEGAPVAVKAEAEGDAKQQDVSQGPGQDQKPQVETAAPQTLPATAAGKTGAPAKPDVIMLD